MREDRRPRHHALLATIVAAHLAAIWLLLQPGSPSTDPASGTLLTVFDVIPRSPPPIPPPPSPTITSTANGGGSPGIHRQRPALAADRPAPPAREVLDATFAPAALPLLADPVGGSAAIDLGLGGENGRGDSTGSGEGSGDGPGRGTGVEFARASWVRRPSNSTFEVHWPSGSRNLVGTVIVDLVCLVRPTGKPYRCRVRSERPRGLGFYRTALAAMPEALVRPVARDGAPMWDTPVLISVEFGRLEVVPPIGR